MRVEQIMTVPHKAWSLPWSRLRLPSGLTVPLRVVLIVPLAIELAATSGLIIALNARNAESNASLTAENLLARASDQVSVYLDGYMSPPQQVIRTMAEAVANGLVNPGDVAQVAPYLARLRAIFPSSSYLNYSLSDSTLIGVGQTTLADRSKSQLEVAKPAIDPTIYRYQLSPSGQQGPLIRSVPFADFRKDDWFATPLKLGRPTWTSIYNWPDQPDVMVVSAGMPMREGGRIIGIAGVDVFLSSIGDYLEHLRISPHSVVYVTEPDGMLVATSTGRLPFDLVKNNAFRRLAIHDPDPVIRKSAQQLQINAGGFESIHQMKRLRIERGPNDLLVRAVPWSHPDGLRWIVVVAAPELDFTAGIRAQTRANLLLTLVIIALALVLGWRVVRTISRTIERVAEASQELADRGSVRRLLPSRVFEINRLTESFVSMAEQLLSGMRQLEERNLSMEAEIEARTRELRQANQSLRKDVSIAASIQREMLFSERELNALADDLDIGVVIVPSREVAGDLYDCIPIGPRRWCFCVGDVSGKGVPAALLMSTCLSLVRAYAEILDSPAAIMERINNRLSLNNQSCSFTTLIIMFADYDRQQLLWCNAGHNPPVVIRSDGAVYPLSAVHGPAVGATDQATYIDAQCPFNRHDAVVLYTDGASEMFNRSRQRYGLERMLTFFDGLQVLPASRLVRSFLRDLSDFASGESQHDDITVMAFRFGRPTIEESLDQKLELLVPNRLEALKLIKTQVQAFADEHQLELSLRRRAMIVVDELLANSIRYGCALLGTAAVIRLRLLVLPDGLQIELHDNGNPPFNPLSAPEPLTDQPLEDRAVGGLGLHLVRQLCSDMSYEHISGMNVTRVWLRQTGAAQEDDSDDRP